MPTISIEEAIDHIKHGRMIILSDDEDRENEGDFVIAAEFATPEAINFMAKYGRGLICVTLTQEKAEKLHLDPMAAINEATYGTDFTISVDARDGITTGISAHDRSLTIQKIANPDALPGDLVRPGHIFPIRAKEGGVLKRAGQTEGSVDLARLAGVIPVGVICEILNEDGTMARFPDLEIVSKEHNIPIATVRDLIAYRVRQEKLVCQVAEADLPTEYGHFRAVVFEDMVDQGPHFALVKGVIDPEKPILVRVHSSCLTGDIFHSLRCDCGPQLQESLRMIEAEGNGILLYMNQEGRGIGLANKIRAYKLQEQGYDTVEANIKLGFKDDLRDYGIGAQILHILGVKKLRLITNNPRKIVGIAGYGLEVVARVPLEIAPREKNRVYLTTKRDKLGHLLSQL
ncbi:MAG: bifunctional 3,4-dihydroxy-2-butanone-4-phosphate synthase/GTP cyclohydrolase II [Leptospirillum sp.]|nr:bifunctional 3,4-dihydroxy-2-butanone-4-phosphate synthase/GTP cyclohydrolase II [Nitrospiraceae bacterium]MDA8150804.1 bifunctional 3,4-dihydroxy-2-butanone-4-phosphate synthase/GTP cyclohydrolase II [Nitrospiraceae bacterium]